MAEQNKIEVFVKEYGELVEKHQVDFATYPVWVPDEQGGFRMTVRTTPVDIAGANSTKEKVDKDFVAK